MNSELFNISQWLAANKLSLNVAKSKLLIFTNQKNTEAAKNTPGSVEIRLNGEILEEVDHAKYLGVLIDNKLKLNFHIDSISLKLAKGSGLLAKIRHFVPSDILRSLYFSFINPYVDYNLLNWSMAPKTNLDLINTKLNKQSRSRTRDVRYK